MNALFRLLPVLFLICASAVSGAEVASARPTRIAVIGDATAADLSALLTAELAKQPGLVLVEREAFAKIGDERAIREMAAKDGTALGRLLAADGLLFLSKGDAGCEVRFTAVRLGMVLFDVSIDPKAESKQIAENLGGRIAGLAPKLELSLGEAVPISLLGLHCDLGGARANAAERAVALLLEKNLVATPKLVVLERRHAGALALEHDLLAVPGASVADAKPAAGLWWLDGTLALPDGPDGEIAAVLRVRSPAGTPPVSIEVRGSAADLPKLAAAMALPVAKATGGGAPAAPSDGQNESEARQYLMEGLWAVRHGKREEALAAFDSAELLGERAPDLLAGRIDAQLKIGSGTDRKPGEGLDERADGLLGALHDLDRYVREKGEERLLFVDAFHTGEGKTRFLRDRLFLDGSEVLRRLREAGSPRTDSFRTELRTFADFDPFRGKAPSDLRIGDAADEWCESPEEEEAFYHLRSAVSYDGVYFLRYHANTDRYCRRFLASREDRQAALVKMLGVLVDDPKTRLAGLFVRAVSGDPATRQRDYQAYLGSLWENREALQAEKHLYGFIDLGFSNRTAFPPPADPKLIAVLRFYLQTETKWGDGPQGVWHPEFFPKEEAPSLWDDLEACKARCLRQGGGGLPGYFGQLEDAYVRVFGEPPGKSSKPLAVTRAWFPGQGASDLFGPCAEASDGLWILDGNADGHTLTHLGFDGRDVVATPLALPFAKAEGIVATAQFLYVSGWTGEKQNELMLGRYDLEKKTWQTRRAEGLLHLFALGEKLYFSITGADWAVGRYDWDKNEKIILASSRRTPPLNQFDSKPNFSVRTVFAGPGGKPCVRINRTVYDILETPGPWPETFSLNDWYDSATVGGRTVLFGPTDHHEQASAVAVVDPAKTEPEEWLGMPEPLGNYGLRPGDPVPPPRVAPEWAKHPLWPGNYRAAVFGIRGDDLFAYVSRRDGADRFHILWFRRGDSEPVRIPIEFTLGEGVQKNLHPYETALVNRIVDKTDPAASFSAPVCVPTPPGLFFKAPGAVAWFLPYKEIDAYLAAAKK